MRKNKAKTPIPNDGAPVEVLPLVWLRAVYAFHTLSYRDPRGAFAAAVGLPVVSPTTVLLGICSTLYELGRHMEAEEFLKTIQQCRVKVDPPQGAVFFRAFHQLRRYVTQQDKGKGKKPGIGFTEINQGTREYGLLQGPLRIYVGVPERQRAFVAEAMRNRDHVGTHDSLCSLVGNVEEVAEPADVLYEPLGEGTVRSQNGEPVTVVTLSRFLSGDFGDASPRHWRMSGGSNTELVPFVIPGGFTGTRSGKIYRRRDSDPGQNRK
jgi:hypothetical protein